MTDNDFERMVDHMLRVAKPGNELHDEVTNGPDTEDTKTWVLTKAGTVEVREDRVYPAMHRLPTEVLRTLTKEEARVELVARFRASPYKDMLAFLEKRWGKP